MQRSGSIHDRKTQGLTQTWADGVPEMTVNQKGLTNNCDGMSRMLRKIETSASMRVQRHNKADNSTVMGSLWSKVELESNRAQLPSNLNKIHNHDEADNNTVIRTAQSKVEVENNRAQVRNQNTISMGDKLSESLEKTTKLSWILSDARNEKALADATVREERATNFQLRQEVHGLVLDAVSARRRLVSKRQADLEEYRSLMDPTPWHVSKGKCATLEAEIAELDSVLKIHQIGWERELGILEHKLQCQVVAEQQATALSTQVQNKLNTLEAQIAELEAELAQKQGMSGDASATESGSTIAEDSHRHTTATAPASNDPWTATPTSRSPKAGVSSEESASKPDIKIESSALTPRSLEAAGLKGRMSLDSGTAAAGLKGRMSLDSGTAAAGLKGRVGLDSSTAASLKGRVGLDSSPAAVGLKGRVGLDSSPAAVGLKGRVGLDSSTAAVGLKGRLGLDSSPAAVGLKGRVSLDCSSNYTTTEDARYGLFVQDGNPVAGLECVELDIDGISELPASLRATYLSQLETNHSQLEALNASLKKAMLATSEFSRSLDFFECQEWINNRTAEIMDSLAVRVLIYDDANAMFSCMTLGQDGVKHDKRYQAHEGLTGPGAIVVHPHLDPEESLQFPHVVCYSNFPLASPNQPAPTQDASTHPPTIGTGSWSYKSLHFPDVDRYSNYPLRSMLIGCFANPSDTSKVSGVLQVFNKTRGFFNEEDAFAFRYILRQANVAMANAVSHRQQRDLAENLAGLQRDLAENFAGLQVTVMNPVINDMTRAALTPHPTPPPSPRVNAANEDGPSSSSASAGDGGTNMSTQPPRRTSVNASSRGHVGLHLDRETSTPPPKHVNPKARRASLTAYTSYQQVVPMTNLVKESVRRGDPITVARAQADSRFDMESDKTSNFYSLRVLAMPILNSVGDTIAAIQLTRGWPMSLEPASPWQDPSLDAFSESDVSLCKLLCQQAKVAFENIRLCERMENMPKLLHDTPSNLSMDEVAMRVVGAVMEMCPCEEIRIMVPCEHRVTYSEIQMSGGDGEGKHYPLKGLMALPFRTGSNISAIRKNEVTKVFWANSSELIKPEYLQAEKKEAKKEVPGQRTMQSTKSIRGLSKGHIKALARSDYSKSLRASLAASSINRSSTKGGTSPAKKKPASTAGLLAGSANGLSGSDVDPANLSNGFKNLFLLPVYGVSSSNSNSNSNTSAPQVIAVIQLVNRMGQEAFNRCDDALLRVLASQASVMQSTAVLQAQLPNAQKDLSSPLRFLVDLPQQSQLATAQKDLSSLLRFLVDMPQQAAGLPKSYHLHNAQLATAQKDLSSLLRFLVDMPQQAAGLPKSLDSFTKWLASSLMDVLPSVRSVGAFWIDPRNNDALVEWKEEIHTSDPQPQIQPQIPNLRSTPQIHTSDPQPQIPNLRSPTSDPQPQIPNPRSKPQIPNLRSYFRSTPQIYTSDPQPQIHTCSGSKRK
eukprot:gene15780-21903_t